MLRFSLPFILAAAAIVSCNWEPAKRKRSSCDSNSDCNNGQVCGPHARCTERCKDSYDCMYGEQCRAKDMSGSGFCVIPCDGNNQSACDSTDLMGGRTDCRHVWVEHPDGSTANGYVCSDPLDGAGTGGPVTGVEPGTSGGVAVDGSSSTATDTGSADGSTGAPRPEGPRDPRDPSGSADGSTGS